MSVDGQPPSGRDRILAAALHEFAEHGQAGASIRGIARRADVSPALVQHHFRTKDGLREACDGVLVGAILASNDTAALTAADLAHGLSAWTDALVAYLTRSFTDGTAPAQRVFDAVVDATEDHLRSRGLTEDDLDVRGTAAAVAAMRLGPLLLHQQIRATFPPGTTDLQNLGRVGLATLTLLSQDAVPPAERAETEAALREMTRPR